mgnify:CR=1 FL=1
MGDEHPRALVMSLSDASTDPRPRKHSQLLEKMGFSVDVLGFPFSQSFPVKCTKISIAPFSSSLTRRLLYLLSGAGMIGGSEKGWFSKQITDCFVGVLEHHYDVVLVEDIRLLPTAINQKLGKRVIFDAREFYPAQFPSTRINRAARLNHVTDICARYLAQCDGIVTVSVGISRLYKKRFGVESLVVRNLSEFRDIRPEPTTSKPIRLVHHSIANRERRLDQMIDAVSRLPAKYLLDLYLMPSKETDRLRRLSERTTNVRVLAPVPHQAIVDTLVDYDAGILQIPPVSENQQFMLPNKLFEFIQARLCVISAPSPEVVSTLSPYDCAFFSSDFTPQSLFLLLDSIDAADVRTAKQNTDTAARELSLDVELNPLAKMVVQNLRPRGLLW